MPKPRVGDGVYVIGKKQPNGKIVYIDWGNDREVIVECYDTKEHLTLEWDSFTEFTRLNQWMIREA